MRAQDRDCHSEEHSDEGSGRSARGARGATDNLWLPVLDTARPRASFACPWHPTAARPEGSIAVGCMLVTLLGVPAILAQTEPPLLSPNWDHTFEQGIEWCAPVGDDPATALLICTKDSRIEMIDLRMGQTRLAEPIAVQPGTRFAGTTGNIAYGCGLSRAYAFLVSSAGSPTRAKPG